MMLVSPFLLYRTSRLGYVSVPDTPRKLNDPSFVDRLPSNVDFDLDGIYYGTDSGDH
jgi:hypothetical protein